MKKRICILTTVHPIDDVRVYRKIALSLVKEYEVIWIGPDKFFFEKDLTNDGIHRILFKNKKGFIGRLCNNIHALKTFLRYKKDIHVVYFPDPDIAFFYTRFIKSKKIIKIFDIHEVYHKHMLNRIVKGIIYTILGKIVESNIRKTTCKVDLILGVSDTVLKYYINEKVPHLVIRSCLPQNFANFKGDSLPKKELFTIYHGKNTTGKGTLQVLNALRILKEKSVKCKVIMMNQGKLESEIFKSYVDKYDIKSYIDIFDNMPFIENLKQISQCHAGLIAYGRNLGIDSLPNRLFEYMALGVPAIVPDYSKEIVSIVIKEKCGLVVDTEDSIMLAEKLEYIIKNPELMKEMGERGKDAFLKRHNWEIEIKPLYSYLRCNL